MGLFRWIHKLFLSAWVFMVTPIGRYRESGKYAIYFSSLLIVADTLLTNLIILKIPYTEIDWVAYMQEVGGVAKGQFDYYFLYGKCRLLPSRLPSSISSSLSSSFSSLHFHPITQGRRTDNRPTESGGVGMRASPRRPIHD